MAAEWLAYSDHGHGIYGCNLNKVLPYQLRKAGVNLVIVLARSAAGTFFLRHILPAHMPRQNDQKVGGGAYQMPSVYAVTGKLLLLRIAA